MKTQIVKTEVPGRYVLIVAPNDGSEFSINFQCLESELKQLYVALRSMFE